MTGRLAASGTSMTEGAQRMPNDRLRAAMHASRIDALALAAGVTVDVKTVERWLAGRVPHSRHRTAVARIVERAEVQLWPTARPSAAHDGDSGELLAVYAHRTDLHVEEWWRLLTQANERIDLLAYALLFLPEGHPRLVELLTEKAAAGVSIRIALADPEASETTARSIEEQLGPGGMAARIRNALLHFTPLKDLSGVEVRQYASPMYNSVFRFDEEMLVTPHLYGTPGYRAPLLHLRRGGADGPFEQFGGHVERLWSISTPVWAC
jgi:hypothetical protein